MRAASSIAALLLIASSSAQAQTTSCAAMNLGDEASLNGFRPFPGWDAWNQNISAALVDSRSAALISFIGTTTALHADFGAGTYDGTYIGIPNEVVSGQPFVSMTDIGVVRDNAVVITPVKTATYTLYATGPNGTSLRLILRVSSFPRRRESSRSTCWSSANGTGSPPSRG